MALPLAPITNLNGSAIGVINNNSAKLVDEFAKTFYKDGSVNMDGPIDMDSNRIINLPRATTPSSPVTLEQFLAEKKGDPGTPGSKGDPGGNVMSVGLFAAIVGLSVPVGTDLIQTSGHFGGRGYGSARYAVGATTDPAVAETRYSTNTLNGRPVTLIEAELTVEMFGARADWNGTTGTDNVDAFQAAINYAADVRGGGTIYVSGLGPNLQYRISGPLDPRGKVTLRGNSSFQGGSGTIYCQGAYFLSLSGTGFPNFNLESLIVQGNVGRTTDFMRSPNGAVWAYSKINNCYFVNFRELNAVMLGNHFTHNNFQNFRNVKVGGADMVWIGNYANHDVLDTTMNAGSVFWLMEAVGATEFSHNYLTCLKNNTSDPIVFGWSIAHQCRSNFNQFDGGSSCSLRVSDGSSQVDVVGNRLASSSMFSTTGRTPLAVISSSNINFVRNLCGNLESGAPIISYGGGCYEINVKDNISNDGSDSGTHDYVNITAGSKIRMSGFGVPAIYNPTNGAYIYSPHFSRIVTNTGPTADPQINYLDVAALTPGDVIRFRRTDTTRRWLIVNQATNTNLYDSNTTSGTSFTLTALSGGSVVVN